MREKGCLPTFEDPENALVHDLHEMYGKMSELKNVHSNIFNNKLNVKYYINNQLHANKFWEVIWNQVKNVPSCICPSATRSMKQCIKTG